MAYEDDEGPVSQTNYGLASNPLMPMGDPLAYARVNAVPEANVPRIAVQGMQPQAIMRPQPLNVPDMGGGHGGGAESPNALSPVVQQYNDNQLLGGGNALNQLLQLEAMKGLVAPESGTTTSTTTRSASDVPMGGSPSGPHPRNVSPENAGSWQNEINQKAAQYGNDPKLMTRLFYKESTYDPNAKSPAGALGFGQFMPGTAPRYGMRVDMVNGKVDPNGVDERTDPHKSIDAANRYYADLKKMFNGNDQLALMGYNWGEGNVQKWLKNGADPSKAPGQTQDYVKFITGRPIAPNVNPNVASAGAAPMAALVAASGGFKVPPAAAPAFGEQPKPGQMSPHGGPYVQTKEGVFATDEDGKIVGHAVHEIAPDLKPSKTGSDSEPAKAPSQPDVKLPPIGNDQGTPNLGGGITQPQLDPGKIVNPDVPAPASKPVASDKPPAETTTTTTSTPTPLASMGADPRLQNLWKFMLIRSLFPQIQFRNVGYDPWAVHKFGQGGGY